MVIRMMYRNIATISFIAFTSLACDPSDEETVNSSQADSADEFRFGDDSWIDTFAQASDDYAGWSNAVCKIPFFTTSYKSAVEAHDDGAYADLFEVGGTVARDFFAADLTVAALAEFGGPSPLTHGQWVTKAINLSSPASSTDILHAINQLSPAGKALLVTIQKSLGLSSQQSAMRVVAVQSGLYRGLGLFLGVLGADIPVPPLLGSLLGQAASAASQALNALGFVGVFCTGANTLAAYFDALEWTARAGASAQQAEAWEDDACARINSHKALFGKGCDFTGALAKFDNLGNTKCLQFVVNDAMPGGLKVHGDKNMGYGIFRVGQGKRLDYLASARLANGFIVTKVKVNDKSAANNGGFGWVYVGGIDCVK